MVVILEPRSRGQRKPKTGSDSKGSDDQNALRAANLYDRGAGRSKPEGHYSAQAKRTPSSQEIARICADAFEEEQSSIRHGEALWEKVASSPKTPEDMKLKLKKSIRPI